MAEHAHLSYRPDYATAPGESLQDALEAEGMTQADLALRTGFTRKHINEVIRGKAPITSDFALRLERVLGAPARFWMNREQVYRAALARQQEAERLAANVGWPSKAGIPMAELARRGFISATRRRVDRLREVLAFFGVSGPAEWDEVWASATAQFRKSAAHKARLGSVAAWLRIGEIRASDLSCSEYDAQAFKEALQGIRVLTRDPVSRFKTELVRICSGVGVAVVIEPHLPGAPLSGATRWLSPRLALIQLSLRYRKDDQFWFSFFHEAAHLLLHPKKAIFLDFKLDGETQEEEEANRFAADFLIPRRLFTRFLMGHTHFSRERVAQFANQVGVAPGIVVGRLQHEGILPQTHLNGLKRDVTG